MPSADSISQGSVQCPQEFRAPAPQLMLGKLCFPEMFWVILMLSGLETPSPLAASSGEQMFLVGV